MTGRRRVRNQKRHRMGRITVFVSDATEKEQPDSTVICMYVSIATLC